MSTIGVRNYTINKLLLYSNNFQQNPIDISYLFFSINFNENLFLPYLSGNISLDDRDGFLEALPLLGEEHFLLDIEPTSLVATPSPLQYPNETVKGWFRIYKISPQSRGHQKGSIYSLFFVSSEYFQSQKTRVFKTYNGKKISIIVQELYNRYIKSYVKTEYQKEIDIESTLMLKNYVAPNITAIKAILNLAKEAISENVENAKGAIYMFYETIDKFHFKSLETLMSQESKRKFIYQPKDVNTEETGGIRDFSKKRYDIDSFTVLQTFDILKNMQKGMYASTLITYDFERMSYEEYNYNYINPTYTKKIQQHLPSGDIVTVESDKLEASKNPQIDRGKKIATGWLCTQDMELLTSYDSNITLQSTDRYQNHYFEKNHTRAGGYKEPGIQPKEIEEWALMRQSQLQQIQNIQVEVLLSTGDATLHVGDIIELDMPSEVTRGDGTEDSHKYYSGKYLISAIIQNISPSEGFETTLKLLKNSIEVSPENFDKSILEDEVSLSKTIGLEKAQQFKQLKKKLRGQDNLRTISATVAVRG